MRTEERPGFSSSRRRRQRGREVQTRSPNDQTAPDPIPGDQPIESCPGAVLVLRSFNLGGAERQAVHLANWLHSTGEYRVTVAAFEPGSAVPSLLDPCIPTKVLHPGNPGFFSRFVGAGRLISELRRSRAKILLPFTDWPNKAIGAIWPLTGAKACIWNQRDEGREVTGKFIERRALKQASWFVANSRSGVDFLSSRMGVDPARISTVPNCVVPLKPSRSRDQWRRDLSIDPRAFVTTMVASLSSFKDHETLLRAWPTVQQAIPEAVLLLAGKAGDRDRQIRAQTVDLDGVLYVGETDDVGGLLEASDAVAHSSFREGTPNAVLEGMAAGLPIVATDIPGTRALLGQRSRWLVPTRDHSSLASVLEELGRSPHARHRTGEENRERAIRLFSPSTVFQAWLEIMRPLLRGRCPMPSHTHD